MKVKSESEVAQSCLALATPRTAAYQAPLSMGFSRQEYWSGVPLPSPFLIMVMPKPHNNHSFWKDSSFHSQSCVQDLAPPILLLALVLGLLLPIGILLSFVDLLSLGCVRVFATPQTAARQASLFFTNDLLEFAQTRVH